MLLLMKNIIISPSILSADFANLGNEVKAVEKAGADWLHIDVMDNNFVPNLSFGAPIIKSIRPITNLFFDVHLMITNPKDSVETFAKAGADLITFHIEASGTANETQDLINKIHKLGKKAGISLRPRTPIETIEPFLATLDLILIMTVEPGFGGQSFMEEQLDKVEKAAKLINNSGRNIVLQVDGGINEHTIASASEAGANCFVAGSAIFKNDYQKNIKTLKELAII